MAALAAVLLYCFRAPLVRSLIETALGEQGFPDASVRIESVRFDGAVIGDVVLVPELDSTVGRIDVRYRLSDLAGGRLGGIVVEGLRVRLDFTGEGPPLGELEPLIESGKEGGGGVPALPPLEIRDARILALTAAGAAEARIDGALEVGRDGGLGGEQVDLMMRALQNFEYEDLSTGVDMNSTGYLRLSLSMAGHNPDVLEGYPFRFNMNLEGDATPLLEALKIGRGSPAACSGASDCSRPEGRRCGATRAGLARKRAMPHHAARAAGTRWEREGPHSAMTESMTSAALVGVLAAVVLGGVVSGCQPTVKVEAPREPITINLNIKLDADVRVRLEEQAKEDIEKNPSIF